MNNSKSKSEYTTVQIKGDLRDRLAWRARALKRPLYEEIDEGLEFWLANDQKRAKLFELFKKMR